MTTNYTDRMTNNRVAASTSLALAFGLGLVTTVGCADNKNQRLTISDSIPLASFPPEVIEISLDENGNPLPPVPPADDRPTALGLDRSNFEPLVYTVPIDGTRHEAHGFDRLALTSETARQRGEFPTATSALETGGNSSTRWQVAEVFAQPFYAATGIVTSLIVSSSGARVSPSGLYERAPSPADPVRSGVIHTPLEEAADESATEETMDAADNVSGDS
ncbi:MAG: hypothetical protein AAFQ17_08460 [Pseudomonadota bacterium]